MCCSKSKNKTVTDRAAQTLSEYGGREIVLGIRPEDIYESTDRDKLSALASITAHLDVVEPMGNEIFLYFDLGGRNLVARIDVRVPPKVNTDVDLVADMERAHFFDKETGRSLLAGGTE